MLLTSEDVGRSFITRDGSVVRITGRNPMGLYQFAGMLMATNGSGGLLAPVQGDQLSWTADGRIWQGTEHPRDIVSGLGAVPPWPGNALEVRHVERWFVTRGGDAAQLVSVGPVVVRRLGSSKPVSLSPHGAVCLDGVADAGDLVAMCPEEASPSRSPLCAADIGGLFLDELGKRVVITDVGELAWGFSCEGGRVRARRSWLLDGTAGGESHPAAFGLALRWPWERAGAWMPPPQAGDCYQLADGSVVAVDDTYATTHGLVAIITRLDGGRAPFSRDDDWWWDGDSTHGWRCFHCRSSSVRGPVGCYCPPRLPLRAPELAAWSLVGELLLRADAPSTAAVVASLGKISEALPSPSLAAELQMIAAELGAPAAAMLDSGARRRRVVG